MKTIENVPIENIPQFFFFSLILVLHLFENLKFRLAIDKNQAVFQIVHGAATQALVNL